MKAIRCDFSRISSENLEKYSKMLEELSFCISKDEENLREYWGMLYRLGICVRGELIDRREKKRKEKKNTLKTSPSRKVLKKKTLILPKKWEK